MPSSFNQFEARTNVPESCALAGTVVTNNTTPTVKRGKGFTVSKPSANTYRVTWNRSANFIGGGAILHKVGATARFLTGPVYVADQRYVDFLVTDATGTGAEPASTDEISFVLMLQTVRLPR
jgi:hypothetical protein